MDAIWAQDFDFMTHGGGAQLTDRAHFLEGIRRGHNIRIWTPGNPLVLESISPKTLVIASNPVFLPTDAFKVLIDKKVPYVYFFHDYMPICKWRLYFPKRGTCYSCERKGPWLEVLTKAKMLIWLSPLHRETWIWLCPELKDIPYRVLPSPINTGDFRNMRKERSGIVAMESLYPFKGRDNVLRWAEDHPEVDIDFIGGNPEPILPLPPNCRDLGPVPYESMNEVYNRYEYFLHLPVCPTPFDRAVAEAALAGCRVIGNRLIGALSWDWFNPREMWKFKSNLETSPSKFWRAIEDEVAGNRP